MRTLNKIRSGLHLSGATFQWLLEQIEQLAEKK
jgi:hypothetical protein